MEIYLATLGSIALVGAIGIGTFAYIFWPHCDREEKTLATDSLGRSTISCFEACTSLGTSMEESIELKSASGKKMTIMKYEPNAELSDAVERPFQGIKRSQLIGAMRALFVFQHAL